MKLLTHYLGWSFALLFSVSCFSGEFNQVISIGDRMPAFKDLPATDGKTYSSSDFDESLLVLVSLSNSCPFSRGIEKDLISLVDQFKDQSVRVVAISYNINKQDQLTAMTSAAKERNFNFTYLRNDDQTLGRQLGTTVTPEWFVFDKDRKLIYTGLLHNSPPMLQGPEKVIYLRGEPTTFYLADVLNAALKGEPAPFRETKAYGCTVEYRNAQ